MSIPYKRILCPVDFDGNSGCAVKEAAELARWSAGHVFLLHAVRINPLASEGFMLGELQESQIRDAHAKLEQIAKRELIAIGSEIVVELGDPADVILATKEKLGADLVVMATHARRAVARWILGSVAERVVRESTTPVLIVHPGAD